MASHQRRTVTGSLVTAARHDVIVAVAVPDGWRCDYDDYARARPPPRRVMAVTADLSPTRSRCQCHAGDWTSSRQAQEVTAHPPGQEVTAHLLRLSTSTALCSTIKKGSGTLLLSPLSLMHASALLKSDSFALVRVRVFMCMCVCACVWAR